MANQFLVETHNYISRQIEESRQAQDQAATANDTKALFFYNGKLDELKHLRAYLSETFDLDTQRYY